MKNSDQEHGQFVDLLEASSKRLYSYVRTLVLNDVNDAEDVFQSTCVAAWTKFHQYEPDTNFGAWVCQIAYYEVLRYRDTRRQIKYFSDEVLAALADVAMPIAEQINERRESLAECVKKLPDGDLEIVQSRYFDAIPPKDMASQSGRSVHAIYRDLKRINRILLRCVERTLGSEAAT